MWLQEYQFSKARESWMSWSNMLKRISETVTFSFTQSTMNLESPIIRSLWIPFFMAISISIQMSMNCAILLNPRPGEYLIWRKWFCLKNNITSQGWNSFRTWDQLVVWLENFKKFEWAVRGKISKKWGNLNA